ncbi:MAG: hypothetical protein UR28_C0021G0011 [Candidatus Peregrinibacteria bacterium GW2011_GWF2_33_10]|nr:MAG: hypothetical protein UR28_C0021G0011 [Candidatus Peregrinibacteria bacterium GW2011_GWF2_33_10]OGJ44098.1 MAG: hypothetical protein A2272_00325 [Candidatus Peregrinibacteria bacterium RIFOXYA12_FULL_33_12]OGJ44377.1 MAG: hypothetical protein A2263_05815 [Candidatus Peregrinibacteria bacterium RIFOXYA2_FULL_33_21]OGJ50172.1 MAG: hypothetical protein A2307_03305 [Candidatus Peregrinibacteria bacterium RIFOXYB2_FULL_33_20]
MKKNLVYLMVILAVMLFGTCASSNYKLSIFDVFDALKNISLYQITDITVDKNFDNNNHTTITGKVIKGSEHIKEPYVIVMVEFYNKGLMVDKKSATLNMADLKISQTRQFQISTDQQFTNYHYYLVKE